VLSSTGWKAGSAGRGVSMVAQPTSQPTTTIATINFKTFPFILDSFLFLGFGANLGTG
jgi:hypothetical protein